jgi:hypothetical protein
LRSIGYYEDGDDTFCEDCHLDRKSSKCSKCNKHITKRYCCPFPSTVVTYPSTSLTWHAWPCSILNYKDKPYHTECFTCDPCQTPLDGKAFFDLGDTRKCESCHTAEVANAAPKACSSTTAKHGAMIVSW